ncbi:hypothetical protein LINPERHAP1_LOCUS22335 [Linum perenne]
MVELPELRTSIFLKELIINLLVGKLTTSLWRAELR